MITADQALVLISELLAAERDVESSAELHRRAIERREAARGAVLRLERFTPTVFVK